MIRRVARTYHAAFAGLPRAVWILAAVTLVNRSGSMVLPFLSLYLTEDRGLPVTVVGLVLASYGLGSIVGAWVGGSLSERLESKNGLQGPERAMTASLVVSGFVFLLVGLQSRPWAIAIGVFVLAMVADAFRPAVMSAVAARSPDLDRARSLALLRLAANLGLAIGPALGGVLALVDYRWLFVVDAATCWAAAVVLVRSLRRTQLVSAPVVPGPETRPRSPWSDRPFLGLMLVMVLLAMALFQVFSTLPVYYRDAYALREDAIGLLLAMNAALIAMFEMVLIHRLQDLDRLRVAALGALLMCGGFGLMPLVATVPLVAATVVVWTIGEMLVLPMINVVVADRGSAGGRGNYMGLYTMAFSVAFLVGPTAGTWVYEHLGADTLWTIVGALGPVIAAALLALRPALRPAPVSLEPPARPAQM